MMRPNRELCRSLLSKLAVVALASLAACADEERQAPTQPSMDRTSPPPQGRGVALERFPELEANLPAVRIFAAGDPRPELSDADLVDAVRRAGGEVFIGFKPASAARTRETGVVPSIDRATALVGRSAVQALGAAITLTYRYTSAVAATIPPDLAPRLRRLPMVDYVEARFAGRVQGQDTSWGVRKVLAPYVWTGGSYGVPTRGEGVSVTILDMGLDEVHLASGDGPANVGAADCMYVVAAGGSTCYDQTSTGLAHGHGAKVAGIIAARDNGSGYIGIANNVGEFESIRVCNSGGWCDPAWVVSGLNWVRAMRIYRPRQVVNMSVGYCQHFTALAAVVQGMQDEGILLVASAGNRNQNWTYYDYCGNQNNDLLYDDWRNSVLFPAAYDAVIAVSGTLQNDEFALAPPDGGGGGGGQPPSPDSVCGPNGCTPNPTGASCPTSGSRYGPEVDIAAPFHAYTMTADGLYASVCGTSFSAPAVAAVAALVWSNHRSWTAAEVRARLLATAVFLGDQTHFGAGRVDAFHAVNGYPAPPIAVVLSGYDEVRPGATCSWSVVATGGAEPYSFEWTANGDPVGDGSSTLSFQNAGSAFVLGVVARDANGFTGTSTKSVAVSWSAPECLDQ